MESIETEFDNNCIRTTRFTADGSVKSITSSPLIGGKTDETESNTLGVASKEKQTSGSLKRNDPTTSLPNVTSTVSCSQTPPIKITHDVSIGPPGIKTQDAATGVGCSMGICHTKIPEERLLDCHLRPNLDDSGTSNAINDIGEDSSRGEIISICSYA